MKKLLSLFIVTMLLMAAMSGCSNSDPDLREPDDEDEEPNFTIVYTDPEEEDCGYCEVCDWCLDVDVVEEGVDKEETSSIQEEKHIFINEHIYSLSGFILTTTQDEYPTDVEKIICTLENPTEKELGFGEQFYLERIVDGNWENVPSKGSFNLLNLISPIGSKHNKIYDIKKHYNLPLQPAEYRIVCGYFHRESGIFTVVTESNTFRII
ncbi:MAG: hypothetical protein FWH14_06110 [Oscillospiraceae bacterium]|nr:hypothetical protein [Oscillospiraceae bacterium]